MMGRWWLGWELGRVLTPEASGQKSWEPGTMGRTSGPMGRLGTHAKHAVQMQSSPGNYVNSIEGFHMLDHWISKCIVHMMYDHAIWTPPALWVARPDQARPGSAEECLPPLETLRMGTRDPGLAPPSFGSNWLPLDQETNQVTATQDLWWSQM